MHEPLPVFPTAHYVMGGIPTDPYGRVIVPQGNGEEVVPGLYGWRMCLRVGARREPPGRQLAARYPGIRARGRLDVIENLKDAQEPSSDQRIQRRDGHGAPDPLGPEG